MTHQADQCLEPIVYMEVGLVHNGIHSDTHHTIMHTGLQHHLAQWPNLQQAEPKYTTQYFQDHHAPNLQTLLQTQYSP